MSEDVQFRRIRGRIVPIRSSKGATPKAPKQPRRSRARQKAVGAAQAVGGAALAIGSAFTAGRLLRFADRSRQAAKALSPRGVTFASPGARRAFQVERKRAVTRARVSRRGARALGGAVVGAGAAGFGALQAKRGVEKFSGRPLTKRQREGFAVGTGAAVIGAEAIGFRTGRGTKITRAFRRIGM